MVKMIIYKDEVFGFFEIFNEENGTLFRSDINGVDPVMRSFPELLDVGIMGHCNGGQYCRNAGIDCYQKGFTTLSESVFTHKVNTLGLENMFVIDSAATSREEIGNPPHRGTVNKLRELGIPLVPHRARQVTLDDYDKFDYIIGMDTANIRNLNRMLKHDPEGKIYKLLSFAGSGRDIADPWYTGDFDETYRDVEEGSEGFLNYLREKGKI